HLFLQLLVLRRERLLAGREMMIELPPIEADLFRLVDRADEETDPDRQELDFGERYLDVAGDDEPLVENPIEDIDQTRGASVPLMQWRRHKQRILWRSWALSSEELVRRERGYLSN